ncbi:MAG: hypothetical protein ICV67_04685 [Thermoleophilia bacterium]|nr:hypothetical protein [Thermoleophilia bacterium]
MVEVDTVRATVEEALGVFTERVLPSLRELEGYEGVLVLSTPEGKGMLVSFWDTEEALERAVPFAVAELERNMTLFGSPPGREHYEVAFADLPVVA